MEIFASIVAGATTPTGGNTASTRIALPSGFTIDTTKLNSTAANESVLGTFQGTITGVGNFGGQIRKHTSNTQFELWPVIPNATDYKTAYSTLSASQITNSGTQVGKVYAHVIVPITGWTANTISGASLNAIVNGGNSYGGDLTIGTNDNFGLNLETNGIVRASISAAGNVGIGTASPSVPLQINAPGSTFAHQIINTDGANAERIRWTVSSAGVVANCINTAGTAIPFSVTGGSGINYVSATAAGEVTLGPTTGGGLIHTVQSNAATSLAIRAGTGTNATLRLFNGVTAAWALTNDAAANGFQINSSLANGVLVGTAAGAWTLGPAAGAKIKINGHLEIPRTDVATSGTITNYALGAAGSIKFTSGSAKTLDTVAGDGTDGRLLYIINTGGTLTILDNSSAAGLSANRFLTGSGASITITTEGAVTAMYDAGNNKWRVVSIVN
jgi:hypothetical protein